MKRASRWDLAEDVALVTFLMHEALLDRHACLLPEGSRFAIFEGFPGFCDHAAEAGLALCQAFRDLDRDCWIDTATDYAEGVVAYALNHGIAADRTTLVHQARAARNRAVREGLAFIREAQS
jgi:hypothetical protein